MITFSWRGRVKTKMNSLYKESSHRKKSNSTCLPISSPQVRLKISKKNKLICIKSSSLSLIKLHKIPPIILIKITPLHNSFWKNNSPNKSISKTSTSPKTSNKEKSIPKSIVESTAMLTMHLHKKKSSMLNKNSEKDKDHPESTAPLEIPADSITTSDFVKIGMTPDIVPSATVVFISMIDPITKQDGNKKETSKELRNKDGEESVIPNLQLNKICNKH